MRSKTRSVRKAQGRHALQPLRAHIVNDCRSLLPGSPSVRVLFLPFGENVSKIDRDLRHAARVGIKSNLRAILGELDPVRRNDNEFERARHIDKTAF